LNIFSYYTSYSNDVAQIAMLELLVQYGADIKAEAFDGRTPCGTNYDVYSLYTSCSS